MPAPRLHWTAGARRTRRRAWPATLEWIGLRRRGRTYRPRRSPFGARVVRLAALPRRGPGRRGQGHRAAPQRPPDGGGWLACIGGQVVGRAALPLQAVRVAEAALGGD